jgi:hypothetical protein
MRRHEEFPDRYDPCTRCGGTGEIRCRTCNGTGSVVGPDRYVIGGRMGRRFGLKVCTDCRGRGTRNCGVCMSGSVHKPWTP